MSKTIRAALLGFSLIFGVVAHAGAAYQLFVTPEFPAIEVCQDKFGTTLFIGGEQQPLHRVTLDLYETPNKTIAIERHSHDYGLDLIDSQGQRHNLIKSRGGFGSCDFREGV